MKQFSILIDPRQNSEQLRTTGISLNTRTAIFNVKFKITQKAEARSLLTDAQFES